MDERIARAAESLDFDPQDVELFEAVVRHLEEKKDWKALDRAYRAMLRKVGAGDDGALEKKLWTRLALLYRHRMDAIDSAILALEMRRRLEPDHGTLLALGDAYEVARRLEEAALSYETAARAEPLDADAYNRLFEMQRERGELDAALRAAQSLVVLRAPVEEAADMVFELSPTRLPELRPLDEEAWWKDARAPEEDLVVTNVMRFVLPSAKPELPPVETDALMWAARMLGAPQDDGGAILKPRADFEKVTSNRRLLREEMFVAGREATIFVSPHYGYARAPDAELTVAFHAAVKAVRPTLPLPAEIAPAVDVLAESLASRFPPRTREALAKAVDAFMQGGARADLGRWQRGIRLTRLRAGVLLAGGVAGLGGELGTDDDELPSVTKRAYAVAFNVGSAHGRLRAKMGWALGAKKPEEEVRAVEAPDPAITWVTARPDGRQIAVGEMSGRLLVWAPSDGRIVTQRQLPSRVSRAEWTAGGERLLAIAADAGTLHVLSADGAHVERAIDTRHGEVLGLAVHPSKPWAATTGGDGHVRIWDLESGEEVFEEMASAPGSVCALSAKHVAVGTRRGAFDVWEIATKKDVAGGEVFAGTYVSAMAFSPDGESLIMGGGSGRLVLVDVAQKWRCVKEWRDLPPKPIATNDVRFAADGKQWVAAHSDDRASLFAALADPSPMSLGQAFWLEKKPWARDFIVSSACFLPNGEGIVTAHFTGRLRVFAKRAGHYLAVGDVLFDAATGAPQTFGPIATVFPRAEPPAPEPRRASLAIGDREHRARSLEEMELAASLHPCTTCGAAPKDLAISGEGEERTLSGECRFCKTPAAFTFVVEGDPRQAKPRRYELGDERPSTMIEPRALTSELERLHEHGIDDSNRERALTCVNELLKFPLVRDGERGDALRAERDRLLAESKPETPVEAIVRALAFRGTPPATLGELEAAFGVQADFDVKRFWPRSKTEVAFTGFVKRLAFEPIWDIHHQSPPKDIEDARRIPLVEWSAMLAGGAGVVQDALRRALGAPRVKPNCHQYGTSWVVQTRGDEILLTWGRRIPDWAQHVDEKVRASALLALAKAIAEAPDAGELARAAAQIPPDAGIAPREVTTSGISLELVPAMPMLELGRSLRLPDLVARPRSFHGDAFEAEVPSADPENPTPPRIGPWRLTLSLDGGGPSGGEIEASRQRPYHLQIRRFGPKDLVRHVRIGGS